MLRNSSASQLHLSSRVRTLLVLGRVSNLPTVWSNCLAGWWLGGGGSLSRLLLLCLGASCLYVGGMYLNDAFDAEFDRQHRRERPIPSQAITELEVWRWGAAWMILGVILTGMLGAGVLTVALLLAGCIVLYDAVHKFTPLSPVLMAGCRFWLFLLAASAGSEGVTGLAIWGAFALAAYVIGLSYIAKVESAPGAIRFWPLIFLAGPLVIGFSANAGLFLVRAALLGLLLAGWVAWCLQFTFGRTRKNYGRTVAGLLAGIVWVDALAVCGGNPFMMACFLSLFLVCLFMQRFIPAT